MQYHLLASDYDGTLANDEEVSDEIVAVLQRLKQTERVLVLVTGRRLTDLKRLFPAYEVFDHIVAENGALIYHVKTGEEILLASPPPDNFISSLQIKNVIPLEIGKVIVATWEPHQNAVLDSIKECGLEWQVIFNKGAVMALPPGLNKAFGLRALLKTLHFSPHNVVAIGDAENDNALLQTAEYAVAVQNALPSLKEIADWVTIGDHGKGVVELAEKLLEDECLPRSVKQDKLLTIGKYKDGSAFGIAPYRSGILLSGVSGGGKSTFTVVILETIIAKGYQVCLIDPEGDYLKLPGAVIIGNESAIPTFEEIAELLKSPDQNIVICILSMPIEDRPAFFSKLLAVLLDIRKNYGHPHWILMDEAHHLLVPGISSLDNELPAKLMNFILISTSPDQISKAVLSQVGTIITIGENSSYPIEQFCKVTGHQLPLQIPSLEKQEACIWNVETNDHPFVIDYNPPTQLQQRHKKKYAFGDISNEFVFTGKENKLSLRATNLMMFAHLAEGIDDETWFYHLQRHDYEKWFRDAIHDDDLAALAQKVIHNGAAESKKNIIEFINQRYTT